ncbi:alkaline phosphatase D family protein [soil metagenome]
MLILIFSHSIVNAQDPFLISGPMVGFVEHRSALIWIEVSQEVKTAAIRYWEKDNTEFYYEMDAKGNYGNPYNPIKFELVKLKMNTVYQYEIMLNNKTIPFPLAKTFKTKEVWEGRKPAPDFSFMMGSCTNIRDAVTDNPNEDFTPDAGILSTMANLKTDFMLWLGDNLFFRESDYSSVAGMHYRYSTQRKNFDLQDLLCSRPNYAIWDDHDYGPNDSNRYFELKAASQQLFKDYWGNKSYGEPDNEGIYSKFSWSDCDFFLTDDRSFRSPNEIKDSLGGKPNCDKKYWGEKQLLWLKNSLLSSKATFKFIAVGNEVLNPMGDKESLRKYPCEFNELMAFIAQYKIDGIIFLTGDRHFSEVCTVQTKGMYKLYDICSSSISSKPVDLTGKSEMNNTFRLPNTLVSVNNFSILNISGEGQERKVKMITLDKKGEVKSSLEIPAKELKFK